MTVLTKPRITCCSQFFRGVWRRIHVFLASLKILYKQIQDLYVSVESSTGVSSNYKKFKVQASGTTRKILRKFFNLNHLPPPKDLLIKGFPSVHAAASWNQSPSSVELWPRGQNHHLWSVHYRWTNIRIFHHIGKSPQPMYMYKDEGVFLFSNKIIPFYGPVNIISHHWIA